MAEPFFLYGEGRGISPEESNGGTIALQRSTVATSMS
jgi:hypothetical protein